VDEGDYKSTSEAHLGQDAVCSSDGGGQNYV
jgi:hypothetical protein